MQSSKERNQEKMKKKTLGMMISSLRKEHGMTQLEFAEKMAMIHMIMKGVALAMGVAVTVLSFLNQLDNNSAMGMLGIGLACLAITSLAKKDEE